MNFERTKISLSRSIWDYGKIQNLYSAVVRCRGFQVQRLDLENKKLLNVGCGPNHKVGFVNLDYDWQPGVDLCWDITRRIPVSSNTLEGIYSEHCLEHLTRDSCAGVLKEFRRLLKRRSVTRIVVPDIGLYLELYAKSKREPDVTFPYAENPEPGWTPLASINRVMRGHGHLYGYDAQTMGVMLQNAGFHDIRQCEFMSGRDNRLLVDSPDRALESLYMEAVA